MLERRPGADAAGYSGLDVIDALIAESDRVVLDPSEQHAKDRLSEIADNIRVKAAGPYMHLKALCRGGNPGTSGVIGAEWGGAS